MPSIAKVAEFNDRSEIGQDGGRRYVLEFYVYTDAPWKSRGVFVAGIAHPDLPWYGDTLSGDTNARVVEVNVTRVDDTLELFKWEATYSTDREGPEQQENPLLDDNRVNWSVIEGEESYFEDVNGDQVLNSIGQQFEELPVRFAGDWEVSVTVNQATFNATQANALKDTVNSLDFDIEDGESIWTIGEGVALLVAVTPSELRERNGVSYYEVEYKFKLNPRGWNESERYLDYGTYELDDGEWVPVKDGDDNDIVERFPLDGAGSRVSFGSPAAELEFQPYETEDHGTLPVG